MPLETITSAANSTIADLNPAWPLASDGLGQADDHKRAIKRAVQLTFPHVSDTVNSIAQELDFAYQGGTVSGNAMIKGGLSVSGTTELSYLRVASELSVAGAGLYANEINVSGQLSVGASAVCGDTLRVDGTTSLSGTVVSKQAFRAVGTLTVSGSAVVQDRLDVHGELSVSGAVNVSTTLSVGGAATITGTVNGLKRAMYNVQRSATVAYLGQTATASYSYNAGLSMYYLSHHIGNTDYMVQWDINVGTTGSANDRVIMREKAADFIRFEMQQSNGGFTSAKISLVWVP